MSKSDFIVMSEMSQANMDISMCFEIVNLKRVRGGGHITIGVGEDAISKMMNSVISTKPTYYCALYIINREQFDKIKEPPSV